jgi:hypothetical protein
MVPLWYEAAAARGWVERIKHVPELLDALVLELQYQVARLGGNAVTGLELSLQLDACYNSVNGVGIMAKGKATQLTPIAS